MRDGNRRVRDKFDISLEPRQVALLFVLCLVILILVFALGIIVGRGLKNPTGVPEVAQVTTEADEPPVDAAAADTSATLPADDEAPKLKFFAEGSNAPQREASAVPPAPVVPPGEEEEVAPAPAAAQVIAPEPAPKVKPEPKAEAKPAKAKAEKPKAEKVAYKDSGKKAAGKFTIQVSAFQSRAQADHLVSNLKHKGYSAYIAQATIPGKGVWYRVRIGKYGSRDEAQTTANTLKRKEGISTYVTLFQ